MKKTSVVLGVLTLLAAGGVTQGKAENSSSFLISTAGQTTEKSAEIKGGENEESMEIIPDTGPMTVGMFPGNVVFDSDKGLYFLELRGARLPFKASPRQALNVEIHAPGKDLKEKNRALLYGIVGPEVTERVTLLINPDEADEVLPAVRDLSRYIKVISSDKLGGLAYTKPGGPSLEKLSAGASQVLSLYEDSSRKNPIILIKGPESGATQTRVSVLGEGKFVVEGETYDDLYKAADLVSLTIIKMLCGSPDCPDASACATGGSCGCGI